MERAGDAGSQAAPDLPDQHLHFKASLGDDVHPAAESGCLKGNCGSRAFVESTALVWRLEMSIIDSAYDLAMKPAFPKIALLPPTHQRHSWG